MNQHRTEHEKPTEFMRSRYALGLLVFGAVAGYFLLGEHRAHVFGALPYLLLLACPLMHVFMHGGHVHHGHHGNHDSGKSASEEADQPKPGDRS